ncbi:MAG: Nif3-like dinuclear metal center hexameric protein [Flavobacteriales bacterium]|nr:Nif3-like dinuclear metal center hexameric protein [Flavobacteriales bacterium]
MKISEVIQIIEEIAPLSYQESYDNSGLIVGKYNGKVTGVLICLDSTEEIVDEAIANNCNLIIAHHPILFSGLKRLNGSNYIEKTILKAIKNDVAIYAAHTNLDNAYNGVNYKIAEKLGLKNCKPLVPKKELLNKLVVFCPITHFKQVKNAMFGAGAGTIGDYKECSFNSIGEGTFKPEGTAKPFVGTKNELHTEKEVRVEMIVQSHLLSKVLSAMIDTHPYEEVAYDIFRIENRLENVGSGLVGELEDEIDEIPFLENLKTDLKTDCIRYTNLLNKKVKKVALCGGAGSFLLSDAIRASADVFITGDFKYHQFFDAENKIIIADIGHYESEQFTKELIYDILTKKITNFAVRLSEINTNPINYL